MERYSEYKDSGVKWLGEIPSHWEVEPFGKHFSFRKGLPITKANLIDSGEAVISYGQIHAKENLGTTLSESLVRYVSHDYLKSHPQCLLTKDDFVFADTSEDIAGSGNFVYNDFPANIFAGYHTIVAKQSGLYNPSYYAYLFKSECWRNHIRSLVNGVKVYSIGRKQLKSNFLLFPSCKEQDAIVRYLDAATSKIDKAIAMQQKMIDLLNERKQIIIQNAVTKGLDENVEMKDSGVEWIGMIPKHWKVRRGKFLFRVVNEYSTTGQEELLTVSDRTGITPRSMKNVNMFMSESLIGYKNVKKGDICSNIMWMWHGAVGVTEYNGVISPSYGVYRQIAFSYDNKYLDYMLRLPRLVEVYGNCSTGLTESRLRLYPDDFMNLHFFVPPLEEQKCIVLQIQKQIIAIEKSIENAEKLIALLQERKQIIINEVVTGKVKVS